MTARIKVEVKCEREIIGAESGRDGLVCYIQRARRNAPMIRIIKGYCSMREIYREWTDMCGSADAELLLAYEEKLSESEQE